VADRTVPRRPGVAGEVAARGVALVALLIPAMAGALEPRFDHRDQQGGTAEFLAIRDVLWKGTADATNSSRGAVRLGWGFDPTGDGDELLFGGTFSVVDWADPGEDRLRLTFDARYRACVGTEELKTLLDIGLWASAAETLAVGPLVGLGFMYDFSRNFGLFASGFVAAGAGQSRAFSVGGGAGIQFRYE
jgi:hypothetical protein